MRIAHVSDCYFPRLGGIEHQVHGLAARQHAAGHEVQVITSVAGPGHAYLDDLDVWRPARRSGSPGRIRYETSWAGRGVVLDGRFDVVHVHASSWSPLAFATVASAARNRLPAVVTLHSMWAYAEPLFAAADRLFSWRRWPVVWSAVSSIAAQPLRRVLDPRQPVAVLPNGVDAGRWRITPREPDPGRVVAVTVGRLAERKRPRQLLHMLREARAALPDGLRFEAVIIGDGPLRPALQRYLQRHDMDGWVRLTGAVDHAEIRSVYRDADFYIAPARLESFGIAALEARCAGLPVVAYADSGISDYITHGVEGLLAHDDADLTRGIVELASNRPLLATLRLHNTNTAASITWPDILAQCESLYAQAHDVAGLPRPLPAPAGR